MKRPSTRPFPIMLEVELLDRLSEPVRDGRAKSVSAVIRDALEDFDFGNVVVVKPNLVQISVRLPQPLRATIERVSRQQHVSVVHLLRAALEAHLTRLEADAAGQLQIEIEPEPSPAALETPAVPRELPVGQRRRGGRQGGHRKMSRRKVAAQKRRSRRR